MLKQNPIVAAAIAAALLSACGDPEVAAEEALQKAAADWSEAREIMAPQERVREYDAVIKAVERVADKYAKTPLGGRIAAGREAAGVSLSNYKSEHSRLSARADCYAAPNVECLTPFTKPVFLENLRHYRSQAAQPSRKLSKIQQVRVQVCEDGFATAIGGLEHLRVNTTQYVKEIVQLGFSAGACDRPDDLIAAAEAAFDAQPGGEAKQAQFALGLLSTAEFHPAWPVLAQRLEDGLAADVYPANLAGGVATALASFYAANRQIPAALEKVELVKTLGFRLDRGVAEKVASYTFLEGATEDALAMVDGEHGQMVILHQVSAWLRTFDKTGQLDLAVVRGAVNYPHATWDALFPELDLATTEKLLELARRIEEVAGTYPTVNRPTNHPLHHTYANLAVAYERLNATEAADASIQTLHELTRPRTTSKAVLFAVFPEAHFVIALRRGDYDTLSEAQAKAQLLDRVNGENLMLRSALQSGNAEQALTLATNRFSGQISTQHYQLIIETLTASGHGAEARRVLAAMPTVAPIRATIAWQQVGDELADGDAAAAKQLAEEYELLNSPLHEHQFAKMKATAFVERGDPQAAQAAIREAFALGQELDADFINSDQNSRESGGHSADEMTELAFSAGYFELGDELFREARHKT